MKKRDTPGRQRIVRTQEKETPALSIFLLGPPRIECEESLVELDVRKGIALLAYLAVTGDKQSRGSLISLLWPESSESRGRHVLRNTLYVLKKELPGEWIDADRESIGLKPNSDIWVDVVAFHNHLNDCSLHGHTSSQVCGECIGPLTQAVALHRDDFLRGFSLKDSVNFDDWQFFQAERLRLDLIAALERLLRCHAERGELDAAVDYARRWVALDPLDERAHFRLMEIYASSGLRLAALQQYRECVRVLEREIGAQPSEETTRLWESIENNRFQRSPEEHFDGRRRGLVASPGNNGDEIRLITVLFIRFGKPHGHVERPWPGASSARDLIGSVALQEISRFGGIVERNLTDGLLVVFGKAQMHEGDPEAAVRSALRIRAEAEKRALVIVAGINSGRLFIRAPDSSGGPKVPVDNQAVSLAIRLARQAGSGQILVGESTYRLTRRLFDFQKNRVGKRTAAEGTNAYRLNGVFLIPWKSRDIDGLNLELVGRNEELEKLRKAYAEVIRGEGQIVCITGEAGVGKSRLIEALREDTLGTNTGGPEVLWLEGRCAEAGMAASYWPFIDMLNQYFGPARSDRIARLLDEMQKAGEISEDLSTEIGAALGNLLSAQLGDRWDGIFSDADAAQVKHRTFMAIKAFFISLAKRQPLTLVFEDLHWCDSLSVDLISLLMDTLISTPLLLVCNYRPGQHNSRQISTVASRKCPDRSTLLTLRDLGSHQSRRLVQSLFGPSGVPAQVEKQIVMRSGGNPFFISEIARSLVEAGDVYSGQGVWHAKERIGSPRAPESIQSVVLSRIDQLDPALKDLIRIASVIGRIFQQPLLRLLSADRERLEESLQALESHSFIYRERVTPETEYSFNHMLTREAIYQSIPSRKRQTMHEGVADSIEMLYEGDLSGCCYQLAHHYSESGNELKAVEFLIRAGERSRRAHANDEAIDYFQRRLKRIEKSGYGEAGNRWELDALTGTGRILIVTGKEKAAENYLRKAARLGWDMSLCIDRMMRIYHWLGCSLVFQNHADEAIALAQDGMSRMGERQEILGSVLMNCLLSLSYQQKGEYDKFRQYAFNMAAMLPLLPYSEEVTGCRLQIATAVAFQKKVRVAEKQLKSIEIDARNHHDLKFQASAHHQRAHLITIPSGDLLTGIRQFERSLMLAEKGGDLVLAGWIRFRLARALYRCGSLDRAELFSESSLAFWENGSDRWALAMAHVVRGWIRLAKALWPACIRSMQAASRIGDELPSGENYRGVQATLGRANLALGNKGEAIERFREATVKPSPELPTDPPWIVNAISGLEAAFDDTDVFQRYCREFHRDHPDLIPTTCDQWYLEPAEPKRFFHDRFTDDFISSLSPGWRWLDPFDDCFFSLGNGLRIQAPNGRGMWRSNHSAPRILRQVSGSFAAQTVASSVTSDKPAIGGILLWSDEENYLRIDIGVAGPDEITFMGCIGNVDRVIGRGSLPSEGHFLRVERIGDNIRALCSGDGSKWFSVGQVEFSAGDVVEIGLHAIGCIDRTVYHGAYGEGTEICFESFHLWVQSE